MLKIAKEIKKIVKENIKLADLKKETVNKVAANHKISRNPSVTLTEVVSGTKISKKTASISKVDRKLNISKKVSLKNVRKIE